jgi:hypothetical protein
VTRWPAKWLDRAGARSRIKRGLRRRERRAAAILAASYWTQADLDAVAARAGEFDELFGVEQIGEAAERAERLGCGARPA